MTRQELISSLRELAYFYEEHPDFKAPDPATFSVYGYNTREDAAIVARELGSCDKRAVENHNLYYLERKFGALKLSVPFLQDRICTRKVVGTRKIETVAEGDAQ